MSKILYINKNVPVKKKSKWIGIINLFFALVKQKPRQKRKPQQRKVSPTRPTNPLVYTKPRQQLANFHEMPRWRHYHLDEYGPDIGLGVQYPIGDPRRYGINPSRFKNLPIRSRPPISQEIAVEPQPSEPQTQILIPDSAEIDPEYNTSQKTKVISGTISDLYPSKPRSTNRQFDFVNQRPRRIKEVLLPRKHYHQSPA